MVHTPRLQWSSVVALGVTFLIGRIVLASDDKAPAKAAAVTEESSAATASSSAAGDGKPGAGKSRYTFRSFHDPDGIGKFYMGREIAHVMGHQGIAWLERETREQEERLTLLMEGLRLEPGMTVADIGAGSGLISRMIAQRLGEDGIVLAVDIQPEMLEALRVRNKLAGVVNIEPVLGTTQSPGLKPESVDLAVMVDVYHEFDFPYEMLLEISKALKPGGRVAFVEYRKEDRRVPIKEVHKMTQAQVKKEASLPELNLEWVETYKKLPWQHVVIFRKLPADSSPTSPAAAPSEAVKEAPSAGASPTGPARLAPE